MTFDRITTSGYHAVTLHGVVSGTDLEQLAANAAKRRETERVALRKLAHFADNAADFRSLADALGLDLALLTED